MKPQLTAERAEVFAEGAESSCKSSVSSAVRFAGVAIRYFVLVALTTLLLSASQSVAAQVRPDKDYLVYVVSESADKIALIRFGPNGARIDHQIETGDMPVDA